MYNAPYQGVANQLSQYGRYGDSMLVHMNPIEVQGLASLSPTGKLTRNPVTGQPEAFLPFLAPILGSMLGSSLLTGTGAALLGGAGLSSAAAGALGSAAATTLATGDLEQGIMSGLTGFGIGSALGGLSDAVKAGTDVATKAATEGAATTFSPGAAAATMNPAGVEAALQASEQAAQTALQNAPTSFSPGVAALDMSTVPGGGVPATPPPTFTERFAQPFTEPTKFVSELTKPSSFLPIYVGESGRLAREQELMGRGSMRAYEEEQEKERQKTLGQIGSVFDQIRAAYPVGYRQGGQVASYAVGGGVENAIRQAAERAGYGGEYGDFSGSLPYNIPSAENVQLSLRGQYALPPPAASYSALDVGGEGYMPGFAPEFQYFTDVNPNPPPPAPPPPPPPPPPPGGGFPPGGFPPGGSPPGGWPIDDGPIDFGGTLPANFNPFGNFGYFPPPATSEPSISAEPMDFSGRGDMMGGIGAFQAPEELMFQPQIEDINVPVQEFVGTPYMPPVEVTPIPSMFEERDRIPTPVEDTGFDINRYLAPEENLPFLQPEFLMNDAFMAEGGMTGQSNDNLVEMTVAAIRGEIENGDQIIREFVRQYGPEMFSMLRDQVLQEIVPGAQTEGMVRGEGGGQDDLVEGMIGSQQRVAVSPGEYIIPADVVSLAGGGYSGDGAQFFDSLVNDIRQKTMGTTEQIKPYRRSA